VSIRSTALAAAAALASCAACACNGERIELGAGPLDDGSLSSAPFGAPELVTELAANGADDDKPTLTADRLELYFLSTRDGGPGGGDVWRSTRAEANAAWGTPALVAEVSSPSQEKSPAVSADGLTLWIASDRSGGKGGLDVWVATRSDRGAAWSAPVPVDALNSSGDEIPRPPGQGQLVMPLAVRPASGSAQYQIEFASRAAADAGWNAPVVRGDLDTANTDVDGFLLDDGLTVYFSSDRAGQGGQDLFVATRPSVDAGFAQFEALSALNSSSDDRDPWLSADGSELYFTSDRTGNLKIYRATRTAVGP
jgi:Tol biopolymer transport system component